MLSRIGLVALAAAAASGENYAVLMCGSKGYANYRHHADVAHAYQVLTRGGYKAENIITMMYNDVPNDPKNPIPGTLYNQPAANQASANELYAGVKDHIDYSGNNVTAANFLGVLSGNSTATGGKKVLQSGADDNVFVYFADHGGIGLICTPGGGWVHAADLLSTFEEMHKKKMYKQLVFYLEACESGSMFMNLPKLNDTGLPNNTGIYALSAAGPFSTSSAYYCPGGPPAQEVKVGDVSFDTCLGDQFSINWLENADKTDLNTETLQRQWETVKSLVTESSVMQWGDLSIASRTASTFEGSGNTFPSTQQKVMGGAVDSRDVQLVTLYNQYMSAPPGSRAASAAALVAEIQHREAADEMFGRIAARLQLPEDTPALTLEGRHGCWKRAHEAVREYCGGYSDYSLKHSRVVAAACNLRDDADGIVAVVKEVCTTH